MMKPKVSVIIAVYNAEKYIEKCVRSLFGQTFDSLEYIFVDDCSPDNSIDVMLRVLDEFPERKSQVKVIRHEVNQGVSQSRQDGMDAATGEYTIHCDPDDWVELNMYETLYNKAKEENADLVLCDFRNVSDHTSTVQIQKPNQLTSDSLLESITGASFPVLHGSLWNKLISSTYSTKAKFPKGVSYCEDVYVLLQILRNKDLCIAYVPKCLYNYKIDTEGSLVKKVNAAAIQGDLKLIEMVESMISEKNDIIYVKCLKSFIIGVINSRMSIYNDTDKSKIYKKFSPYIHYIKYNRRISNKEKLILWMSIIGYHKIVIIIQKLKRIIREITIKNK